MKSKVRSTLLLVVLFVVATSSLLAVSRGFNSTNIETTLESYEVGFPTHAIIGTKVKVAVEDADYSRNSDPPDEIVSLTVDFSEFGGLTPVLADSVYNEVTGKMYWTAEYTVVQGSINTNNALMKKVIVSAVMVNNATISNQPDIELFAVNNTRPSLGTLNIVTTISTNGQPATIAIVGSIINVTFNSTTLVSAIADFSSFGGPNNSLMVKTDSVFTASYTVLAGNIASPNQTVKIYGLVAGNPNLGFAEGSAIAIDNVLPSASDFLTDYLAVNDVATSTLMKKGDTLYLRGTLKTTGNTIVDTLWINWSFAFPGDATAPLSQKVAVVNGAFVASFQPAENSLSYNSNLGVKIVKMKTRAGNVTATDWPGFIVTGNNAAVPAPIVADLIAPSITGVRDLFYDLSMPLRFSPVVAAVDSFGTTPNDFKIWLTIPNWGIVGGPHKFKLRFTSENRSEFFLAYTYGDSLNGMPIVESIGGNDLQVRWNGKNADGTLEFDADEITYGITLWEIADEVGNQAVFTHVSPDETINEYEPHQFVSNGAVYNRIHVVVDNVAPTYEQDLLLVEQADSQMFRMINDVNTNDLWDLTENDVRFTHTDGINTDGAVGMNLQVRRTFTNDTNPRRYENQFYWVVLQKQGTFDRWVYTNSGWMLYDAFITDIANKRKPITYSSDTAPVSNLELVVWNLENRTYPAGRYILNAYVQDNAGNIVKSLDQTVTITDVFMDLPLITGINLISQHVGINPTGVNGYKNFYLTTGDYYVSQDILTFEIEVNNKNFLRETDGVELNTELLGISSHVFVPRSAFGDDHKALVSIPVASIPELAGLTTPGVLWTIGGANQPSNYIQATSWSSLQYSIYGANQYLSFPADDDALFNLIIPTQPQDLETDPVAYNMSASAWSFSPGKPNDEYDAVTNPANDNSIDATTLSFSVPTHDTDIDWTIELIDGTDMKRSWTGTMLSGASPRIVSRVFDGLDDSGAIIALAHETKTLTWKVIAQAHPYNDPGYTNPSAVISDTLIVIDNTNPTLINGAGTYISETEYHRLYLNSNLVPVVTQRADDNFFEFSVTSNERLPLNGWSLEVRKNDGTPLVNNGTTVTANIDVTSNDPVGDWFNFNIKATINGLSGEVTNENTVLVLRLPNDLSGNPARYNDPVYPPYGNINLADLRYLDSAEYYFYFNILDAKPQVTEITFTNPYDLPLPNGTAGLDINGVWNKALNQAWLTKDMADTLEVNFKLTAKVEGGVYYNHPHYPVTTWKADLSALLGGAYTAIAPTSIENTTRANEDSIWVLTWDSLMDSSIGPITTMNAWSEGSTLEIPVKIVTNNGTADVHTEEKAIALKVDYRPSIDSVTFKYNGTEINNLLPTMNGVQVQATITTMNELNNTDKIISFTMSNPDSTWVFDYTTGGPSEAVTQDTLGVYTYVYTWDDVSFTERPDVIDDFWIANFVFTCNTIYGSIDTYEHDMVVFENPSVVIQGIVENRNLYENADPDGWFAPEHTLRSLYTFVSEQNETVPPIEADFDLIEDTVNDEDWQYPDAVISGSTKTVHNETLTRGSNSIPYAFCTYVARWMVNPDVQSVWNAYDDGEYIPIRFRHNQVTGQLIDNQGIKVDKMVPRYDDMLEYARSDSLPAANAYRLLSSGFPHTPQESYNMNIALNVDEQNPWTAGEKIYLKYRASDYTGSGMLDIQTIAPQTGWVITEESTTPVVEVDGNTYWEKIVSLVPVNPVTGNTQIFKFGRIEDAVGHVNHDLPINSTDHNYNQTSPQLSFTFSSEYITAHESIKAFQIFNGNVTVDHSSPYVKAGQPLGVKIKLSADTPQPTREEGVESFEVSSVKLNPRYFTGGVDTLYVDLVQNPADSLEWYLPVDTLTVDLSFDTGTSLQFQYMIEYTLHYYNTNITALREYVSDVYPNLQSPAIIALVDNARPVLTSVNIWSETLSTDGDGNLLYNNTDGTIRMEGYVVPGDDEGVLEIKFRDVKPTDGSHPTITVDNLALFVEAPIPAPSFSYELVNGVGIWTATYDSLQIIAPIPATNSVTITYNITDVVGNGPTTGNRMVEVVGQGPIIPLITGARYITELDLDTNPETWEERIIPSVATSKIEVDIYTQYEAYIEAVEIVSPQAVNVNPDYTITGASPHFVATFKMDSVNLGTYSNGDTLSFVAKTSRHPYGQAVYNQSYPFEVTVDGKLFTDSLLVVQGEDIDNLWIDGIVSPDRNMKVTAVFKNLGEEIHSGMDPIPNDWFKLTASELLGYDHLYQPNATTVVVDADTITVTWDIPADSLYLFNPALEASSLTVEYQNIYGLTDTVNIGFNIDTQTPIIANYQLLDANDAPLVSFNSDAALSYNNDWHKLRVNFVDLPQVHVGLYTANATFTAYPETYQYISAQYPDALNALNSIVPSLVINPDGSGYVDLQFTGGYSGSDLAGGEYSRYKVTIDSLWVKDRFNNTNHEVTIKDFLFDYNPAAMTLNINGHTSNYEVYVKDQPINVLAYTSSTIGGIEGVEFRLFYDRNGNETYDFGIDDDISTHLSHDADLVFPYETSWVMTDSLYAFIAGTEYPNPPIYRGFLLRGSVITQNRDLYDTIEFIKVFDNMAPIPAPVLDPITRTINYDNTVLNKLDIPVYINTRDAETVTVDIYKGETQVATRTQAITDSLGLNNVVWDFWGSAPGVYSTKVTAVDFMGNVTDPAVAGPNIILNNAIMNAVASTNIYRSSADTTPINLQMFGADFGVYPAGADTTQYVILEAVINNTDSQLYPLNGIESISFKARLTNRASNEATIVEVVPNDVLHQTHISETGIIPSNTLTIYQISPDQKEARVRLAIPNSFFAGKIAPDEDYRFEFWVELEEIQQFVGIDPPPQIPTWFGVDQRAPKFNLSLVLPPDTPATTPISWAPGHQGSFRIDGVTDPFTIGTWPNQVIHQYDYEDNHEVAITWLDEDNNIWRPLVYDDGVTDGNFFKQYNNWNISGGTINTYLGSNFDDYVWVKVITTDIFGNSYADSVRAKVDNTAPSVRFTHAIHSDDYPALTEIGDINGPDELDIFASTDGINGSSVLQLFVEASSLEADAVMPLMMYHQKPNGEWKPVEYDHEAWSYNGSTNMYEFIIPDSLLTIGQHKFSAVARGELGNLEGDYASPFYGIAYNGILQLESGVYDEKLNAVDLVVNVMDNNTVVATISYPANPADDSYPVFVSGQKALAAKVIAPIGTIVDSVQFQYKAGGTWADYLAPIPTANNHDVTFKLLRKDIPRYNDLPWVPGIHLFNGATELGELTYSAADSSWTSVVVLNAGTTYTFKYGVDINNNGNWDDGEPMIDDPKGFTVFTPTLWTLAFNSANFQAQYLNNLPGAVEFRAIPIFSGNPDAVSQSPSRWLVIDNNAPIIGSVTSVGDKTRSKPGVPFDLRTDVNEQLVYTDDIVNVRYEYSGQPSGTMHRKWFEIGNSNTMAGNYPMFWNTQASPVDPLHDDVDNNVDGFVDNDLEAVSSYFIRAIASDRAGNYSVSQMPNALIIDNKPDKMELTSIGNTLLRDVNYIFTPDSTSVLLKATTDPLVIHPLLDDIAVSADFYYQKVDTLSGTWTEWQEIETGIAVVADTARVWFNDVSEAYYRFKVVAWDSVDNKDTNPAITNVIFNENVYHEGEESYISKVGNIPTIKSNDPNLRYGFAKTINVNQFNGSIEVTIPNPQLVNTVTVEYFNTTTNNWMNIDVINTNYQSPVYSTAWTLPAFSDPLWLRVRAQDIYGNNQMSEAVTKLYKDNTSPLAAVTSLTPLDPITLDDGTMVKALDNEEDLDIVLSYSNLPEENVIDVSTVTLRLVNNDTNVAYATAASPYLFTMVNNPNHMNFTFADTFMRTLPDGIYRLEIELQDFAGNATDPLNPIKPPLYQALYIDTAAPIIISVASLAPNIGNTVAYGNPITFNVNYTDLIGLPLDSLKVLFKIDGVVRDSVDSYTVIDSINIQFTWTPSDFDNHFAYGNMDPLTVNAELTLTDYMGHISPIYPFDVNVTYGVPNVTRVMAVRDMTLNGPTIHYVNWNNAIGVVTEDVGTNHTAGAAPLEIFAYVPHTAEIPNSMTFEYKAPADTVWTLIGNVFTGDSNWDFIDPAFVGQYQSQFSINWPIVNLPTGNYNVRTTSNYNPGFTSSIIQVSIYNGTIIPQLTIDGIVNGEVQRGETYALTAPTFIGDTTLLQSVVYKYRYVNVNNNVVSPVSQWMYFGDVNGVEQPAWITTPYSFDWTIYPYYLYNNTVQIVAYAKDKWGTETPITNIIGNNAYAIATIVDTQAPEAEISYSWNGINNASWVSGAVSDSIKVIATLTSDIFLNDLVSVEFFYDNINFGIVNAADMVNNQAMITKHALPDDPAVLTGTLKVKTTDVYANVYETTLTIRFDNVLPTANLVVTQDAEALTNTIERDVMAVLNANPADLPSGVEFVTYSYAIAPAADADTLWLNPETNLLGEVQITAAPWTYNWDTVLADLQFGSNILIKATVIDSVGLAFDHVRSFNVTDSVTPMQIISVAGHAPVNGIIPVRLHDDVHIVTEVNDINIPRVEYLIRANANAAWIHLAYVDVVNAHADTLLSGVFTAFADGDYELGVRAREARVTLGNVEDIVQITLDHFISIANSGTTPANGGYFNGDTFEVNFTVNPYMDTYDEIDPASLGLEYHIIGIDGAIDAWRVPTIGNKVLTRTGANTYVATFTDVDIYHTQTTLLNGLLDFRFLVSDKAGETPNTDSLLIVTNVMYDTTLPEVIITSVTGTGVTEVAGTYMIQLASTATLAASAWDVLYGQLTEVASGIQKVEFFYNDVLIGTDTEAPYDNMLWNTTGFTTGAYTLNVVATDNAGNTATASAPVIITPSADWEPYALITAMNFDGDNANQDVIYAEVDTWNNEMIEAVNLEYSSDGIAWTQFSQAVNMGTNWKAQFNAEDMDGVNLSMIRTVVTYNGGLISTNQPQLLVTYSEAVGGSLVLTQPSIQPSVFYNNQVRITGNANAPRLTTMFDGSFVNTQDAIMVNGNTTVFVNIPQHGEYNFWAAAINYDTWMMQLNKLTYNTYNTGTVTHNGISINLPVPPVAGNFAYFQNVDSTPPVVVPDGFTVLSTQNAVLAEPAQDLTYTVTLTSTPAAQGTVVGMYYNGSAWTNVPAIVTGNTASFTAPSGFIYTVAQYTGTAFNVMFSAIDPQYVSPTAQLWAVEDPTSISFFVYDGMNQGGYTSPAAGDITYQMYLDSVAIPATYNNGYITASNVADLAAGAHAVSVVVTMNDVSVNASKSFNVDITAPVIVATGTQLSVTNRTISATITDTQIGIHEAYIVVTGWGNSMTVPMENLVVNGNVYSYTFTMDDLNALGYDFNYTSELQATWYARNNLEMNANTQPINYTVNIEGPAINFTGFANGLWLNPTFNTPLTFTVTVPAGRTMPTDGVWIDLDEVTSIGDNHIQYMTLAPVSVAGNVYSYSFSFGQMLSPLATAVKLTVEAIDNYGVYNESEQTYGIDMAAPVVWALAPVGGPIDNDGDGLFNEDVPNGVNEDLDWVDLDQDGFWDPEEPQFVDEDPIDYYAAVIPQGTDVVVALAFEDYTGFQYMISTKEKKADRTTTWYYTGASGIDTANIHVSLNGLAINGTITNGTFTYGAGILDAGHYTVVASVPDVVGNVGSLAFEFDVVGGAPTIVFNPLAGGSWWLNTTDANVITFTVNSESQLANGGVVATFYAEPANTVIQGPITPTGVAGVYTVTLLGGIVPADQMAVRLEVVATDVWGGVSTSNQTYGIDNSAPVITITSPAENAQFNLNATVNIMATISDMVATRLVGLRKTNDGKDRPAGSGILSATLSVIAPDGTDAFDPIIYPANTQVISKPMVATQYGTYIINLLAKDNAGNQSMVTHNFMVVPDSGPGVSFTEITWLNSVGTNNLDFTVTSPVPVTVTANIFTYTPEALLMGPLNVSPVNGVYTVALNGGMIPPNAASVRLQVIVTDQFGNATEANYYYSVDRTAPVVTILNPVNGTEITYVDETTRIRIDAQFSDLAPMIKGGAKSSNGSGIASSRMVIIDPLGLQVGAPIVTGIGVTETTHELTNLMLGTYTVRVTVWDIAGNQAFASVNFTVIAAPLPPVALEIDSAFAYPNPMASDGTARFSITLSTAAYVSVRIYDFAGREVRSLDYSSKLEGKAKAELVFDGCNNEGEKLARGTYFARVIANDGKKIVEKIVKIAIKK